MASDISQCEYAVIVIKDWWFLAKPRILLVAMLSVSVGYLAVHVEFLVPWRLLGCLLSIGLIAVSCSLLNQWLEQTGDRSMFRTSDRALASGRVSGWDVASAGLVAGASGFIGCWMLNSLAAMLSLAVLVTYVGVYTPLKRKSFLGTVVGAIAGGLPPVLGWCAGGGELGEPILSVFSFLFVWQFPHFLAISSIYRFDYEDAGYLMLPVGKSGKSHAGLIAVAYSACLLPIVTWMTQNGLLGDLAAAITMIGCGVYVFLSMDFAISESIRSARRLLLGSLVLLALVFLGIGIHHVGLAA